MNILAPLHHARAAVIAPMIARFVPFGSTLLDVGCGNMLISQRIMRLRNASVQGLDVINMNMTTLPHVVYDGNKFPFAPKSFDVTMCIGVLHHILDQSKVLSEMIRVTKKRIIVFEDTYHMRWGRIFLKIRDVVGNADELFRMNFAMNFRTADQWKTIYKLRNLKITYSHEFFNWIRLTHHMIIVLSKTAS